MSEVRARLRRGRHNLLGHPTKSLVGFDPDMGIVCDCGEWYCTKVVGPGILEFFLGEYDPDEGRWAIREDYIE
jgi:hypothetical protein